jgi:hypothetical protein
MKIIKTSKHYAFNKFSHKQIPLVALGMIVQFVLNITRITLQATVLCRQESKSTRLGPMEFQSLLKDSDDGVLHLGLLGSWTFSIV